jgi:hypothetical protein
MDTRDTDPTHPDGPSRLLLLDRLDLLDLLWGEDQPVADDAKVLKRHAVVCQFWRWRGVGCECESHGEAGAS